MRTRKQVISHLINAFSSINYVGLRIEPIMLMEDPDDKIDGDYRVKLSIEVEHNPDRFYMASMSFTFKMETFQHMTDPQIARIMATIAKRVRNEAKEIEDHKEEAVLFDRDFITKAKTGMKTAKESNAKH